MSQTGNGWSLSNSPAAPGSAHQPQGEGGQPSAAESSPTPQPQYGQYAPGAAQAGPTPTTAPQPQYGQYAPGAPQYGAPAPQYGQYGAGGTGYGQYGTSQFAGPGQPGGFGYAPKPGIIPLRALTLSDILDGAFAAMRSNPAVMFGFSFLFTLVSSAIATAAFLPLEDLATSLAASPDNAAFATITNAEIVTSISAFLAYSIATTMLMGILVLPVGRAALGRVISFSQLWQAAKGRLLRLLALSALTTLITIVASLIVMSPVLVLIGILAGSLSNGGVLLAISSLMAIGGIVLSMFLSIRLSSAPAVLVLEKSSIIGALKRSWLLTAGSFWRIFGILAVTSLITIAIAAALELALALPFLAVFSLSLDGGGADSFWPLMIVSVFKQAISSALVIPFTAAVMSLIYIDLRIRKEGLDVDLAQAAAMEA